MSSFEVNVQRYDIGEVDALYASHFSTSSDFFERLWTLQIFTVVFAPFACYQIRQWLFSKIFASGRSIIQKYEVMEPFSLLDGFNQFLYLLYIKLSL